MADKCKSWDKQKINANGVMNMPENKHQSCANCNYLGYGEIRRRTLWCNAGEWYGVEISKDFEKIKEPIKCVFWTEKEESEVEF